MDGGDAAPFICVKDVFARGANINSSSCTRQISFLFPITKRVVCEKNALLLLHGEVKYFAAAEFFRCVGMETRGNEEICVCEPRGMRPIEKMKIASVAL
jgi:hypothetical protein